MGISYTRNFSFTKGRPGLPRVSDANWDLVDEELANAQAHPFVPNQPRPPIVAQSGGNAAVEQRQKEYSAASLVGIGIKSLEAGPGLILRDHGDGCFFIALALENINEHQHVALRTFANTPSQAETDAKRT